MPGIPPTHVPVHPEGRLLNEDAEVSLKLLLFQLLLVSNGALMLVEKSSW